MFIRTGGGGGGIQLVFRTKPKHEAEAYAGFYYAAVTAFWTVMLKQVWAAASITVRGTWLSATSSDTTNYLFICLDQQVPCLQLALL